MATDQRRERTRLVVQGSDFLPGEAVRLTLTTARAHHSRDLVANPQGMFQVEVSAAWRRCAELPPSVSATGSLGSAAALTIATPTC